MSVDALHEAVFAHPGPWTEEEYFALPETPARIELVDGVLVVSPLSSASHQRLTRRLGNALEQSCPNRDWEVFDGLNVRLRPGLIRIPDVVVAGWAGRHACAAQRPALAG